MSLTTLFIIVLLFILFFGGGGDYRIAGGRRTGSVPVLRCAGTLREEETTHDDD